MRIAFFGTPGVAVPSLEALIRAGDIDVAAVVTNPDRPRGRSGTPQPPPVKAAAVNHDLEVLQPRKPIEIVDRLEALQLDACAIVAYGALLPRRVLDAGGRGFVNLHFSLLPRWRGAAPVQHAIRAGDRQIGVTTFVLDEGMDTGPILRQETVGLDPDDTAGEVLDRLAAEGAPILVESLRDLVLRDVTPTPQQGEPTLAPKINPEDVEIDWTRPADDVVNLVLSANPAPGAHTTFGDKRLKVWRATGVDGDGEPGTVVESGKQGVHVAAGRGAVRLDTVQPEGKARMDGVAFANGYQPAVGDRLGS